MSTAQAVRRSSKRVRCDVCGRKIQRKRAIGDEEGNAYCDECAAASADYSDLPDGAWLAIMEEQGRLPF